LRVWSLTVRSSDSFALANSMSLSPSKCEDTRQDIDSVLTLDRFVDTEKWRKEFGGGVDDLTRTFNYTEKEEIFKYYPQYYHKTDKVCSRSN
jgi:hypothetical protein